MDLSKEVLKQRFNDIQLGIIKRFNNGTFSSENNRKYLLQLFIEKLFEDNIILSIDDIPKIVNYKLFQKYKIHKMLGGHFDGSFVKAMMFLYPNKWNSWEFNNSHVPNNTWNDENNVISAVRDMVLNKIKIDSFEDIFKIGEKDFYKYNLPSILNYYNFNTTKILQLSFPEYYLPAWKFNRVAKGYWGIKENRISALKELIENELNLSEKDIPKVITSLFIKFNYPKFSYPYKNYYNNWFLWVNEIYPNKFKPKDFIENIGKDGTKLASREEVLIHDLLLDNFQDIVYFENTNDNSVKLYDSECNQSYVPDWILDDKIIIEHFGLYAPDRPTKFSQKYNLKTKNKIVFYAKYCEENSQYFFIPLYTEDLKNDLQGVKQKLNIS